MVASDSGGLRDSKRGTGYVIPVQPIDRYLPAYDELAMPRPLVPENDATPWVEAIGELLTSREAYLRESAASRAAAGTFVSALDAGGMERYLATLARRGEPAAVRSTTESLSPEKRALLLERLRKRKART